VKEIGFVNHAIHLSLLNDSYTQSRQEGKQIPFIKEKKWKEIENREAITSMKEIERQSYLKKGNWKKQSRKESWRKESYGTLEPSGLPSKPLGELEICASSPVGVGRTTSIWLIQQRIDLVRERFRGVCTRWRGR
jgi:hypothetical protein